MDPNHIALLADFLGLDPARARLHTVSGGSIARAYRLDDGRASAFIKVLDRHRRAILDAERDGLARLAATATVATPRVLGQGEVDTIAWLALEWLEMAMPDADCFARLGVQLYQLHQNRGDRYGLDRDNYIGSSIQPNRPCADWTEFLFQCRLGPQMERLAPRHPAFGAHRRAALEQSWRLRFEGYRPDCCLLHGDLWSGNAAMRADRQPLLFDPAVHYGDRECDLAMADLFGGFDAGFFDAYRGHWPLQPGWQTRRRYYQLYHLLNHANLFGGHYLDICDKLITDLIDPRQSGLHRDYA
jgi:fructosamine-3-kinase